MLSSDQPGVCEAVRAQFFPFCRLEPDLGAVEPDFQSNGSGQRIH
jgi:hypothetical protein